MRLFSRRTTPEEPSSPVLPPASGNGNGYSDTPPTVVATAGVDDDPCDKDIPEDCLHAGTDINGTPVYLPARAHWQVRGGSGSGKSVFLAHAIMQLIWRFRNDFIAVIDLGGDLFLYHFLRRVCMEAGRTLRAFALSANLGYFDPIEACAAHGTVPEQTAVIMNGLGLYYGEGFGKSYFGSHNDNDIANALQALHDAGIQPTVPTLADQIQKGKRIRSPRDQSEAMLRLAKLKRYGQIGIGPDPTKQLSFRVGFDRKEVHYYFLPGLLDRSANAALGTLTLSAGAMEAVNRKNLGLENVFGHFIVEESSLLNGAQSMEIQLPLLRKWGQVILSHQTTTQWYENGRYMPDSIATNCPVRVLFTATCEDDYRDLELNSDEEPKQLGSITSAGLSVRKTIRDEMRPRLERNTIRSVTRESGMAFLTGLAHSSDPLPFKITYPTGVEEHERLSQMPLRTEKERRKERDVPTPKPKPVPVDRDEEKRRLAVLERLLAKKEDLESFEVAK